MNKINRIPGVNSLSIILPKGAEGGKEFARIIDLLLFYDSKKRNKKFTMFNDSSGDYLGLDSFEGDKHAADGITGYQYKFYSSPLNSSQRASIEKGLIDTLDSNKKQNLKKWILVTPDDLTESSTRKDYGDLSWFENIREKHKINIEIEHIGHKKIIGLFLEYKTLCLYYYPELVANSENIRKNIIELKGLYDENLKSIYRNIDFVGMSIYKPEASKGIPIEHIYIPLKVIPETNIRKESEKINPKSFLGRGLRSVILGDPGSGKSTLLRFLSLSGISTEIQNRYHTEVDNRLSILIALRRYADELKSRRNLSLFNFIIELMIADFSSPHIDNSFLEFYLESGNAIVLFDGLDELPDSNFKQIIKDRIVTFSNNYPLNNIIVTSRIVGYENPFRFDESNFNHYRISDLDLPEIEQFVKDWYSVRIENERERLANTNDLVRILNDEGHSAIKELSQNPLLLTIVALVHRIDAVLPDERVVLYQKCTETLLNTWHAWKYRDTEVKNRGRVERRNRRRMEAIAYWMHNRSIGTGKNQRSIVPYDDLLSFLILYIKQEEKFNEAFEEAEDLAVEFLEFIKRRAGLLIEVGDNSYSFVHLTFQEFLASSHLLASSERDGLASICYNLKSQALDPRWYEVIRLLVAGIKLETNQEYLIDSLFNNNVDDEIASPILLCGMLLDGVAAAEHRKEYIARDLILHCTAIRAPEEIRLISNMLTTWINKDISNSAVIEYTFKSLWFATRDNEKESLVISISALNLITNDISELIVSHFKSDSVSLVLPLLLGKEHNYTSDNLSTRLERLKVIQGYLAITSPFANFVSASLFSIDSLFNRNHKYEEAFKLLAYVMGEPSMSGPYFDLLWNLFLINSGRKENKLKIVRINKTVRSTSRIDIGNSSYIRTLMNSILSGEDWYYDKNLDKIDFKKENTINSANSSRSKKLTLSKKDLDLIESSSMLYKKFYSRSRKRVNAWNEFQSYSSNYDFLLDLICECFDLNHNPVWKEAIRVNFLPSVPESIQIFNVDEWIRVRNSLMKGSMNTEDIFAVSWLILVNTWLFIRGFKLKSLEPFFMELISLANTVDSPIIKLSLFLHKIALGDNHYSNDLSNLVSENKSIFNSVFDRNFRKIIRSQRRGA